MVLLAARVKVLPEEAYPGKARNWPPFRVTPFRAVPRLPSAKADSVPADTVIDPATPVPKLLVASAAFTPSCRVLTPVLMMSKVPVRLVSVRAATTFDAWAAGATWPILTTVPTPKVVVAARAPWLPSSRP